MTEKPLVPRNYNKVIPLWRSLKCPSCQRDMPSKLPKNGPRRHIHECDCGARIIVMFRYSDWHWTYSIAFSIGTCDDWCMIYDSAKDRTEFYRWDDSGEYEEIVDRSEHRGFVSHERFKRLIAFI